MAGGEHKLLEAAGLEHPDSAWQHDPLLCHSVDEAARAGDDPYAVADPDSVDLEERMGMRDPVARDSDGARLSR